MLHQLTQEIMDAMLSVSRSWHAFWGLPSRYQDAVQSFNTLVHSNLAPPISQALFKVTSSYRTKTLEQAYALNAIYSKESPLIIVMATWSGKSALFMAPLFWTAVLDKSSCKDWL